jgi:hypothetical protein
MELLLPELKKQNKYQDPFSLPEIICSGGSVHLSGFKSIFDYSFINVYYLAMDFGKSSVEISFPINVLK